MNWLKLKGGLHIVIVCVVLFAAIGFSEKRSNVHNINELYVDVNGPSEEVNYVDMDTVVGMLNSQLNGDIFLNGLVDANLKDLEEVIRRNEYISDAQIFVDLKNNVTVKVSQHEMYARIFAEGNRDHYITKERTVVRHSSSYTPRVLILEFEDKKLKINKQLLNGNVHGQKLFELLEYVHAHEFWKKQVAHIVVKKNWEIEFYGQVSRQKIEFGPLTDFEEKFKKVMILYKKVLPRKGWNTYNRVSVKFKNQIVCE